MRSLLIIFKYDLHIYTSYSKRILIRIRREKKTVHNPIKMRTTPNKIKNNKLEIVQYDTLV